LIYVPEKRAGTSLGRRQQKTAQLGTALPCYTADLAKKPEPPKPIIWNVYKIASKAVWLGAVEATDETAAMEKAAAEFKVPANRLLAIRR
jgi:hypothetical protein